MSVPEDKPKQTKFLLIGETGTGKSSLGNFILKNDVFTVSDSTISETRDVVGENGKGDRKDLIVIDTPSLQESKEFNENFLNGIVDIVKEQGGINGIVIVLNYNTNRISNNIKIMIQIMSKIFPSHDFLKHICIVWNKCYYSISDRQLTNQKEIKRNEFLPELLRLTEIFTGAEENIDIPMYYVDSQPDEERDNIRSEEEIERLIKWGRRITPINIDTSNLEKAPVIEVKEETESMGNTGKYIKTQFKWMRREIGIGNNGEIKYGEWEIVKVMSNEKQSSNPLKTVIAIGAIIITVGAIGAIIFCFSKR
ncbi:AIG1 family protein putative [Entamoeba histolytica]|uniref:AIG1 family protein, putative n=2 Tax=Entamoeba histolytica TaxID=5759 RepID=C4M5W9_ENTH1|nr:AIG1 family protein, putative [Entamoeba histolytica HM-1:IMSS]EAL43338.2 AIG1 family protein, putative [Entamoeba histolytica HM-1:IMSS]GAT96840.1 AIG1 family protein putative [Entamoeba histolytica]|eukprot:XP_648724.2 AIG1 family protein, putative [Entamoeba histolytica HM-1:IMSS]